MALGRCRAMVRSRRLALSFATIVLLCLAVPAGAGAAGKAGAGAVASVSTTSQPRGLSRGQRQLFPIGDRSRCQLFPIATGAGAR